MTVIISTRGIDPLAYIENLEIKGILCFSKSSKEEITSLLDTYLNGKSVYSCFNDEVERARFKRILGLPLPAFPGKIEVKRGDTILCANLLEREEIDWVTVKIL